MLQAVCPVCKEGLGLYDEVFTLCNGDTVAGCTHCLHAHSALEWFWQEEEDAAENCFCVAL